MKVKAQLTQGDIENYFEAEREIREERYGFTAENFTAALLLFHKSAMEARVTKEHYSILAAEFSTALRVIKRTPADVVSPIANGINVRAAMRAGLIDGDPATVTDLRPWQITQLTTELSAAITEAYDIPKK